MALDWWEAGASFAGIGLMSDILCRDWWNGLQYFGGKKGFFRLSGSPLLRLDSCRFPPPSCDWMEGFQCGKPVKIAGATSAIG